MGRTSLIKLLIVVLFLFGCGGSNNKEQILTDVAILDVDSGFQDAPVAYTIIPDPVAVDPFGSDNNHGLRVLERIRETTSATVIGWIPFTVSGLIDFETPMIWGTENADIILIEFSGCCETPYTKDAFDRGVTVIRPSGNSARLLTDTNDPYLLVIGSTLGTPNYGPAVDVELHEHGGTSFNAAQAAGIIAEMYKELNPTKDAAGASMIRNEFIKRYTN